MEVEKEKKILMINLIPSIHIQMCKKNIFILPPKNLFYLFYNIILQLTLHLSFYISHHKKYYSFLLKKLLSLFPLHLFLGASLFPSLSANPHRIHIHHCKPTVKPSPATITTNLRIHRNPHKKSQQ